MLKTKERIITAEDLADATTQAIANAQQEPLVVTENGRWQPARNGYAAFLLKRAHQPPAKGKWEAIRPLWAVAPSSPIN
jgi:hypothetical protein